MYTLGNRRGYSFIFEKGGYDGFSPDDVELFLEVTDVLFPSIANYEFENVTKLERLTGESLKGNHEHSDPKSPSSRQARAKEVDGQAVLSLSRSTRRGGVVCQPKKSQHQTCLSE
jgi:hypothetical protein